jgi:hypothetical protein
LQNCRWHMQLATYQPCRLNNLWPLSRHMCQTVAVTAEPVHGDVTAWHKQSRDRCPAAFVLAEARQAQRATCLTPQSSHSGCYTSETLPVWGANDRLIEQTETKHTRPMTLGLLKNDKSISTTRPRLPYSLHPRLCPAILQFTKCAVDHPLLPVPPLDSNSILRQLLCCCQHIGCTHMGCTRVQFTR